MKLESDKVSYKHKFDFEVGYLVKSPCKTCDSRKHFPGCINTCRKLQEIHARLANTISCTSRR